MTNDARRPAIPPLAPLALMLVVSAAPAAAQTNGGLYVGGSIGAHRGSADFVSGWLGSGGIFGGVGVNPWMDVELDWQRPIGTLREERVGTSLSFAAPGSSRDEIERLSVVTRFVEERRSRSLFSVGVAFHPDRDLPLRVTPRLFVGLVGHWVEDRTTLDHLVIPPGVTRAEVDRAMPPQPPSHRNLGGITVGAALTFRLTPHVSLAPDLRYDYGSIGDEIDNALRMSMRVTWRPRPR
jgi:hypothetical protein